MSTSNIAVIGDRDSIFCFHAVGVDVYPAEKADDVKAAFDQVYEGGYAVIFITEQSAIHIEERLREAAWRPLPSIVLIPNNRGSLGYGLETLRHVVRKAVGADIMQEDE
ncbi:MAG: V-type ATP synthase subunit F [Gemmatimonadota bacterium]|nr:MAG: V-type ATP synthase subunit F [Gemmatimonadota bacterium]